MTSWQGPHEEKKTKKTVVLFGIGGGIIIIPALVYFAGEKVNLAMLWFIE